MVLDAVLHAAPDEGRKLPAGISLRSRQGLIPFKPSEGTSVKLRQFELPFDQGHSHVNYQALAIKAIVLITRMSACDDGAANVRLSNLAC